MMEYILYRDRERDVRGNCKNVADALMKANQQCQIIDWSPYVLNELSVTDSKMHARYRGYGRDGTQCATLTVKKGGSENVSP